jgi:flavin reductase (DIM6/NTAB) family NADH-FMN oxidoreductase RutF
MTMIARFVEAMRRFPAAVNVVAADHGGERVGFTATAVMSLTADPPQIAVAMNKGVSGFATLMSSGAFCVSTLATQHAGIASRFAGEVKGAERFAMGDWGALATGAPALGDAVLNLDCRIVQTVEFSSHLLLVGKVEEVRSAQDQKPLLYINGAWAGLLPGLDCDVDRYVGAVRRAVSVVENSGSPQDNPRERLKKIVRDMTLYYIEQQGPTRDQLTAESYVSRQQLNDINEARKQFDQQVISLLNRGVEEGQFDIEDVQIATFAITGIVAWVHRWYRPDGRLSPDEIGTSTVRLVDRMLSAGGQEHR